MSNKLKILITGSNGFIGKNLVEFYSNKNDIITYTRKDDLSNVLKQNPDVIINCAADIYGDSTMFESNVNLVNNILNHIKNTRCKFIQIGSSAEYGRKKIPSKENDFLDPTTFYEATKAAATLLCVGTARAYNLPIVVARPYSVYGKYEKEYRLFSALYNAYKFDKPMTLNQGYHDFIYIKDFIQGINTLIESDCDKIIGDIVNFGTGIQTSNFELSQHQLSSPKILILSFSRGV
jgi:nucleoside-diphosphate-sugar epimerase